MDALCNHLMKRGASDVDNLFVTQIGKRPLGLLWVTYPNSQPLFDGKGRIEKPENEEGRYGNNTLFA